MHRQLVQAWRCSKVPTGSGRFGLSWPTNPCDQTRASRSSSYPGPRVLNTKTDQTHGRSVALLALPHPKCPIQVELLRVRASYCCFLVLGYYEVPGLYGYRTEPVNTAPYLSLDSLEGRRLHPELVAHRGGVVRVLLGGGGVRPTRPIQTQQGNLDIFGALIHIQDPAARLIPRSKCPEAVSSATARSTISRNDACSQSRYGDAHSSYSKSSANRPRRRRSMQTPGRATARRVAPLSIVDIHCLNS